MERAMSAELRTGLCLTRSEDVKDFQQCRCVTWERASTFQSILPYYLILIALTTVLKKLAVMPENCDQQPSCFLC